MSDTTTTSEAIAEVIPAAEVMKVDDDLPGYTSMADLLDNEPSAAAAVREYYMRKRLDYIARTAAIEELLGFLEGEGELGTRLHNLERFTGIKPA